MKTIPHTQCAVCGVCSCLCPGDTWTMSVGGAEEGSCRGGAGLGWAGLGTPSFNVQYRIHAATSQTPTLAAGRDCRLYTLYTVLGHCKNFGCSLQVPFPFPNFSNHMANRLRSYLHHHHVIWSFRSSRHLTHHFFVFNIATD